MVFKCGKCLYYSRVLAMQVKPTFYAKRKQCGSSKHCSYNFHLVGSFTQVLRRRQFVSNKAVSFLQNVWKRC